MCNNILQVNYHLLQVHHRSHILQEVLHSLTEARQFLYVSWRAMKCEYSQTLWADPVHCSVAYGINPWSMKWTHDLWHHMYMDLSSTTLIPMLTYCHS